MDSCLRRNDVRVMEGNLRKWGGDAGIRSTLPFD